MTGSTIAIIEDALNNFNMKLALRYISTTKSILVYDSKQLNTCKKPIDLFKAQRSNKSQKDFTEMCGVSRSLVGKIENNQT